MRRGWATLIFAFLVMAAPLLFGAVDRSVQAALLVFFAIGLAIERPVVGRTGKWMALFLSACAVILVVKEYAPAAWFGSTRWREILTGSFEVPLPWTHNPSGIRAMEGLIALALGVVWFLWVRTLAQEPNGARNVAWAMLVAGTAVAAVSMGYGHVEGTSIFGLREAAGYHGFGPFPNRNHTATFLAMSAMVGCGCIGRELRHRHFGRALLAAGFFALIVVTLFETRSRGGLLAFLGGLAGFGVLLFWRSPRRKLAAVLAAGFLIVLALFLAFGAQLAGRFLEEKEGTISSNMRWTIWADAVEMWKDAPVWGHGISTFQQIYPLYQTIRLENRVVLHPESSWLQMLVEQGVILTSAFALLLVLAAIAHLKAARLSGHGFLVRAGAGAAVLVIVLHCVLDVPGHRWATAAFGLAALALAAPAIETRRSFPVAVALFPMAVAVLWASPFFTGRPLWSTASLSRALSRNFSPAQVSLKDLDRYAAYFPLDSDLQNSLGMRKLIEEHAANEAWTHFRTADRLKPGSWLLPLAQAMAARPFSPGMALHFYSMAVERADIRAADVLQMVWEQTSRMPLAEAFWSRYVQNHPRLLLTFARLTGPRSAPGYFRQWWKKRANATDLENYELTELYSSLPVWGARDDLLEWMKLHPEREDRDFELWVRLLHGWGEDQRAWELLAKHVPEPPFPASGANGDLGALQEGWERNPKDFLGAQFYALELDRAGMSEDRDRVILLSSELEGAPEWFLRKAAFIQAARGKYREAVTALLDSPAR